MGQSGTDALHAVRRRRARERRATRLQGLAERLPPLRQAGADRAERHPENRGRLLVLQTLDGHEQQHLAALLAEAEIGIAQLGLGRARFLVAAGGRRGCLVRVLAGASGRWPRRVSSMWQFLRMANSQPRSEMPGGGPVWIFAIAV